MIRDQFLYIAINPYMPGIIKIGKTIDIKDRISRLSKPTGVPDDFQCIFLYKCLNYTKKENNVHRRFANVRLKNTKEFFIMNPQEAIDYIKTLDGEECDLKKYLSSEVMVKLPTKKMFADDISQNKIKQVRRLLKSNFKQIEVIEMTKVSKYHVGRIAREIKESALQNLKRMA
jgi:hypothetical protein